MADLFDYTDTKKLAEAGMLAAVEHADHVEAGWSERALEHVRHFAAFRFEFLGEDVRLWAYEQGLPHPPVECAWGAIMVRAARENIIARNGYGTTRIPPQHSKPAVRWQSLIFQEQAA